MTGIHSFRAKTWLRLILPAVIYSLLFALIVIFPLYIFHISEISLSLQSATSVSLLGFALIELIILALVVYWLKKDGRSLKDLGLGKPTTRKALALGVLVGLLWAGGIVADLGFKAEQLLTLDQFKLWGILTGIVIAFSEEVIFRGFLITELKRLKYNVWIQLLVSSLLFAFIHGPTAPFAFVLGIILGGLYIFSRYSLTPIIVAHILVILLVEPYLVMESVAEFYKF
ncbi:CPBP family intramembrane metalloprotease [Candidatus Parcubacteria bacterium]|nr:CPBP family intramembrane metalloprotease [Candidatus Parcubacteria bacterium]